MIYYYMQYYDPSRDGERKKMLYEKGKTSLAFQKMLG